MAHATEFNLLNPILGSTTEPSTVNNHKTRPHQSQDHTLPRSLTRCSRALIQELGHVLRYHKNMFKRRSTGYVDTTITYRRCARKQPDSSWVLGGASARGAPSKMHWATSGEWVRQWGLGVYVPKM